mgnify:FL=1
MHIFRIYKLVVILIKQAEIEYFQYKENNQNSKNLRVLKYQLSDLHENRRFIKKFIILNKKYKRIKNV